MSICCYRSGMQTYFDRQATSYAKRSSRGLWAMVREREYQTVSALLALTDGLSLLDVGCGSGYYTRRLSHDHRLDVVATDSSERMLTELSIPGAKTLLARAEDLPAMDPFDRVLAAGVLEFVRDIDGFFRSASRLLKPGGALVLLVPPSGPCGWAYKVVHEWQDCPTFIRPPSEYVAAAHQVGLEFTHYAGATPISLAMKFVRVF